MFNIIRRFTALLAPREDRDDRRCKSGRSPLVNYLEADLANLDIVTQTLAGRNPRT